MKKKLTLLLVIFINISYICLAQTPDKNNRSAESVQRVYLTKELALTPDEANKFFPVYQNYRREIIDLRKANKGGDPLALEEKLLVVRKKYRGDFKAILGSDERVNNVFIAENNFREILHKELMKRKLTQGDTDDDSGLNK